MVLAGRAKGSPWPLAEYAGRMTAFGGIFRSPKLEGVAESEDDGEQGRLVGLDLESGVVRVRAGRAGSPEAEGASDPPGD
jgi:hypothetical protein